MCSPRCCCAAPGPGGVPARPSSARRVPSGRVCRGDPGGMRSAVVTAPRCRPRRPRWYCCGAVVSRSVRAPIDRPARLDRTIRTIAATRWRPVTSPVARFGGTRVANTSVRTVPAPVRAEMPAPHLTVSVLRPVAGRSREVRGSRLLRIESASTPVPGPAGPPGSTGTPGVAVVVRRTPVAAAAPAAAAVAPPMPFPTPRMGSAPAAAASGAGPEFDVEELTARVLRSIERRAAAQRERMGRD